MIPGEPLTSNRIISTVFNFLIWGRQTYSGVKVEVRSSPCVKKPVT